MTAVAERPAPPAPGQVTTAGRPARRRVDAVTILTIWVVLLMAIPASLVVAPLGAVGGPATIFAAVVLVIYLVTWLHPALAPARGRQPVRAAAVLLTCAVIGTYVSANRHIMPGLERNGIDRGIILICGWLGVLIMASDGIPTMERLKKLLGRVVIGATAMAAVGITQFFTGLDATQYIIIPGLKVQTLNTDLLSRNGLNRPSATAAHPLEFAAVLAMALPIALNRARFAPPGKRAIRWIQVGLIGAALPMTVSRSAVLAVLAVAFVLLPTWPKLERRIAYVVMGLGVAGLWMLVPGLVGTFRTLFATLTGDTSTTSRTSAFSTAMPYISQHPWFGHGFGTFFPATYFFTDDQYLLSLIEIGAVGLFALLALFVTGLVTAQRVRRATKDPEMRDLGQSLTATIAVAMVAFGTFDALSFNMAAGLTFLFLGCTGAALRLLRTPGAQADGQLMTRPDQEPPVLTHPPAPDGPGAAGAAGGPGAAGAAGGPGAAGAVGGLTGLRAGQQANGQPSVLPNMADERNPSEHQADEHLPAQAEQLEQPGGPQEEHVESQVEKLADTHLGERDDGQPERQAEGQPAEPAGAGPQEPTGAGLEEPAGAGPEEPAGAGPEEPAQAQVKQPAKPPWENQLWSWEPQDPPARPHEEGQRAEAGQENQPDETRHEERPAEARQEERPAEARQEERPAEARQEEPARAEPAEAQAEQPAAQPGQSEMPAEQSEVPAEQPAAQAGLPEASAEQPAEASAEQPAEASAEQPAEGQAERLAAQTEQPAQAPWDAWRKAEPTVAQPTAAAPDEQASRDEQPAEPADQPAPEPAGERPEETTIPIPIIRD
jgi:O-antigen ligase